MLGMHRHRPPSFDARTLLERAARDGFQLVQCETSSGQPVWEWRRGEEPRPQFVTRRVALHWMNEFLHREGDIVGRGEIGAVGR
jgi:hypothetical protein